MYYLKKSCGQNFRKVEGAMYTCNLWTCITQKGAVTEIAQKNRGQAGIRVEKGKGTEGNLGKALGRKNKG
jgi:hypothetical protein